MTMSATNDGVSQPTLVGTPHEGGSKLPMPEAVWRGLQADLEQLTASWANELYGSELDLGTATRDDAQRWLLAHMTVVEALVVLARTRQHQLAQVAKRMRVPDERVGAACGISPEGARRRAHRGTK